VFDEGVQHLDGAHALEFVRERHVFAEQDLLRVRDQQAFLTALRQQALALGTVLRLPTLIPQVRQDVITDLPYNALPSVALAYSRIPAAQVSHAYIDLTGGLVQNAVSADGQAILLPTTTDGIPSLVRRLTHDPTLARPGTEVTVWDASGTPGLSAEVGATLHRDGVRVASVGSTPHAGRKNTVVVRNTLVASSTATGTARVLAQMLEAPVITRPESGAGTPIVILVGSDFPTAK
jgi:hypothetical protein